MAWPPVTGHILLFPRVGAVPDPPCGEAMVLIYVLNLNQYLQ